MKKTIYFYFFTILSVFWANAQDLNVKDSITLKNISYGKSAEQTIDVYLPSDRNSKTKTFILLHGGNTWYFGGKWSMKFFENNLKRNFPNYAIVNVDFRKATAENPGFPNQIDDLNAVFDYLKSKQSDYKISKDFAIIGQSAGAHLAMLYSYGFNKKNNILAICDIVGPVDFTDPAYTLNSKFDKSKIKTFLGGDSDYANNTETLVKVSPVQYVSKKSPKTLMFYGGSDPFIPNSQGQILKEKLDKFKVYNEYNLYPTEKHGKWGKNSGKDMSKKINDFFKKHF